MVPLKAKGAEYLVKCSEEELIRNVSGIGKVLAERIVERAHRNWTWDDVMDVDGIGPVKLDALRLYIHKKHQITRIFAPPGQKTLYSPL